MLVSQSEVSACWITLKLECCFEVNVNSVSVCRKFLAILDSFVWTRPLCLTARSVLSWPNIGEGYSNWATAETLGYFNGRIRD